jgi:hypothetical protein
MVASGPEREWRLNAHASRFKGSSTGPSYKCWAAALIFQKAFASCLSVAIVQENGELR